MNAAHAQDGQRHSKFPADAFEREDDLPARNGFHLQTTSTPAVVSRGKYHSVQVNVDVNGLNTLGDAANEPSLTVDPTNPDRMAIGWRQFDDVASNFRQGGYGYSTDAGHTWHFPGVLQSGIFRSDPVLMCNNEGVMKYASLTSATAQDMWTSIGGSSWSGPINAFGGDKEWLAIDRTLGTSRGNEYSCWSDYSSCCGDGVFNRSFDGGVTWTSPTPLPDSPLFGTDTVGPGGEVYIAGSFANLPGIGFCRSNTVKDPNQSPAWQIHGQVALPGDLVFGAVVNPDGLGGQVWVDCDRSHGPYRGNVYVLASIQPTTNSDPADVYFTRSNDGGKTWSHAVRVNHDSTSLQAWHWFGTMSVAPNGRIDVIWNDSRYDTNPNKPTTATTFYTYSIDAGRTWAAGVPITPAWTFGIGYPNQNKIGDYYHLISDNAGASLAYSATFNGEEDIWYLRIPNTASVPAAGG
jgi:hypothetical protein